MAATNLQSGISANIEGIAAVSTRPAAFRWEVMFPSPAFPDDGSRPQIFHLEATGGPSSANGFAWLDLVSGGYLWYEERGGNNGSPLANYGVLTESTNWNPNTSKLGVWVPMGLELVSRGNRAVDADDFFVRRNANPADVFDTDVSYVLATMMVGMPAGARLRKFAAFNRVLTTEERAAHRAMTLDVPAMGSAVIEYVPMVSSLAGTKGVFNFTALGSGGNAPSFVADDGSGGTTPPPAPSGTGVRRMGFRW